MCYCDDTLVISDVFDRETIHDNSQRFKIDYLNQTLPGKEELITLSRPQIRSMSTGNTCDSNTLYASVQNICKGPVKLYDKLSIGSLNTCGLKRKTEYPEFQSLIKQYEAMMTLFPVATISFLISQERSLIIVNLVVLDFSLDIL